MKYISLKAIILFFCLAILSQVFAQQPAKSKSERSTILFDGGWKFHLGNFQMAANPNFDDSNWRNVDLPHDWSIEDIAGTSSPFNPDAIGQTSSAFTVGGIGWYRKSFMIDSVMAGKQIHIQFDGI